MTHPTPSLTVWTDASRSGWGGVCSHGRPAWGVWSPDQTHLHINVLETLAVHLTLLHLSPPDNSTIIIRSDNTVVVSLINKQGSNKSTALMSHWDRLAHLCHQRSWTLLAKHLSGHLNSWADALSRNHETKSDWELSHLSFTQITLRSPPQVDLFAHPGNAKFPTFGCLFPHPLAAVTDALTTDCISGQTSTYSRLTTSSGSV